MKWGLPFLATLLICVSLSLRADELKLKDGTKISGTIVGYEENSFKVKTSYGFAVVQKDQVVSISIKNAPPPEAEKPKASTPKSADTATAAAKPKAPETGAAKSSQAGAIQQPTVAAGETVARESSKQQGANPATTTPPASAAATAPPAPIPAAPAPPPAPIAIREEVNGNNYSNLTYGFEMYKPPDWQVIAGARSILPGAITAMGTEDQTTYLLIGQQPTGKSVASDISAAEERLSEIVDNFRPLGETHVTVSGLPAIERRFRGSVDDRDWSGIVVYVPRGEQLFTIFGMTLASSDLVQIQENVIARTIASLQFAKP